MARSTRNTAAAVLLFAAGWLALAWPWLSGAVTIPWDAKAQFYPQLQFLAASLASGDSPLWTPYVFAGWPQIADPQSLIFSPLHLALAMLGPTPGFRAADLVTFLYLFAGGTGLILFCRDRGWHPAAGPVAALMFAFGGSAAWRIQHTGQIISLAYLPLALWLLSRALQRGSWRSGLSAGVVAGLLALQRDQVALLGLYLLAGWTVWQVFFNHQPSARLRGAFLPLMAAAVASIAIAIVPLTMTALLAAASNRPEFGFVSVGRGSLHPAHLLTLVFGDIFGASDAGGDYWGPPSFEWKAAFGANDLVLAQNMGQLYAGVFGPVLLLGVALPRGIFWDREIRFFSIALIAAVLYALGWYTPVFRLVYETVPGVALFRRPADAAFIVGLLLAICSGHALHRWLTGGLPRLARREGVLAMLCGTLLIAIASTMVGLVRGAGAPTPMPRVLLLATVASAALLLVRRAREPVIAALVLGTLLVADLAWNNGPNESTGLPPAVYDALRPDTGNDTVRLLRDKLRETAGPDRRDRVEMIGIAYHWPNLGLSHRIEHLFGQNPLRLRDFAQATGVGDTVAAPDQRTFAPFYPSYRSTGADLFGVRFIASGVPVEKIDASLRPGDLKPIARTRDAYVYENPRALPRAMFVPSARAADFDALIRAGWPDVDPREVVLLESAVATAPRVATGSGSAVIVSYSNALVEVDVDASAGGFLLLNDVWHPWWRAELDGRTAPLLKANGLFRAVAVPAGRHRVRFSFAPFLGAWEQLKAKLH